MLVVSGTLSAPDAYGATLNVPADHPTIQACIDAAVSGVDECVVAPWTYFETINFNGKAITLRSSGGPAVTVIDGSGLNDSVVKCVSGEGPATVLEGFTIAGGTGFDVGGETRGGGMYNEGSSPTIINCTFTFNTATTGGGMDLRDGGSPVLTGCTFNQNVAVLGGAIHATEGGAVTATDCIFDANDSSASLISGAVHAEGGTALDLLRCTVANNRWGGVLSSDGEVTAMDCNFLDHLLGATGATGLRVVNGTSLITGCTFERNKARGLRLSGGDSTVRSCAFRENGYLSAGTITGNGILCEDGVTLEVEDTLFEGNRGNRGVGIHNKLGDATVRNCAFVGNTSSYQSSGISNDQSSTLLVIDSTFTQNSSDEVIHVHDAVTTVTSCDFDSNAASGIYAYGGGDLTVSGCTFTGNYLGTENHSGGTSISDCLFSQNTAGGLISGTALSVSNCVFDRNATPDDGGAVRIWGGGNNMISNCLFDRNTAFGYGGALEVSGNLTLLNCRIVGNVSGEAGGALAGFDANVSVINCAIAGNTSGGVGAAFFVTEGSNLDVRSSTLAQNNSVFYAGSVLYATVSSASLSNSIIWRDALGTNDSFYGQPIFVRHSNIRGSGGSQLWDGAFGTDLGGNIDADPFFVDPPTAGPDGEFDGVDDFFGDLHLKPDSPAIDSGRNSDVPAGVVTDLEGNPRFLDDPSVPDTGIGIPPIVDMGAFEFVPQPCVTADDCSDEDVCTRDACAVGECFYTPRMHGDVNADGTVDIFDVLCALDGFAGVFNAPCTAGNLDLTPCSGDGVMDVFDILAVLEGFAGINSCDCPAGP